MGSSDTSLRGLRGAIFGVHENEVSGYTKIRRILCVSISAFSCVRGLLSELILM